ncbi:MAG: LemA family protein, partial [Chromatiaceae bacterium]
MELSTAVILAIALLGLFYLVAIYNRLVALRNRFRNAFAQIEVQLKRRHDLIPNLVEIARRYLAHERETLEAVVAARQGAVAGLVRAAANPANPAAITGLGQAEGALTGA